MNRGAVLVGSGVTLGSLMAFLIRAGLRSRRNPSVASPARRTVPAEPPPPAGDPETSLEDVLERYRLAAAV